jgi:prevent-host-death family protein
VVTQRTTSRRPTVREIGVRELKTRASEIVRNVRDHRAQYVITYRGRPVGVLQPLSEPDLGTPDNTAWDELFQLSDEIGRGWSSPLTTGELLSDMRD